MINTREEIKKYLHNFIMEHCSPEEVEITNEESLLNDLLLFDLLKMKVSHISFKFSFAEICGDIERDLGKEIDENICLEPDEAMTLGEFIDLIFLSKDLSNLESEVEEKYQKETVP